MKYRLSDPAVRDLSEIWNYIASDNEEAADRFIKKLMKKFSMLGRHPNSGRRCDELGDGLSCIPIDRYVIFFWVQEKYIEIARVLHGARNIEELLDEL